ncbi:MAG: GspH/FimT family pseudopilin [Thiotrichaceae bacterium]
MNIRDHNNLFTKVRSGFTLIELLIVIVISATLIGLAVPSFQSFIKRNSLATASDEIFTAITYTRIEAIKRRTNVTFCAKNSDASNTCEPLAADADYANGWLVFLDCNNDGVFNTCDADGDSSTPNTTEQLLKTTEAYQGNISITNNDNTIKSIKFGISGRVSVGSGTITISSDATPFRTLGISRSGSAFFN